MALFITFEGPEGAGKTTQIKKLASYLESEQKNVVLTREPGGTGISEAIRGILLDAGNKLMDDRTELLLYAAARAQHVREVIIPALGSDKIVICDRFSDSTLAYQGYGRGLDIDLISKLNAIATDGLKPDLTILLDIDVKVGLQRVENIRLGFDRLEGERLEFHEKVRQGFLTLAEQNPKRIRVISAEQTAEEIFQQIVFEVKHVLGNHYWTK
jgi:dTMP kinase